jgi:hypothetical protein
MAHHAGRDRTLTDTDIAVDAGQAVFTQVITKVETRHYTGSNPVSSTKPKQPLT